MDKIKFIYNPAQHTANHIYLNLKTLSTPLYHYIHFVETLLYIWLQYCGTF